MSKFYAECGDCQTISSRETAREAAIELVGTHTPEELTLFVTVSEIGFFEEGLPSDAIWFETKDLYNEIYPDETLQSL